MVTYLCTSIVRMQLRTKAHMAVLAANVIYGMSFSAIKLLTTGYMPAFSLNVVRILGAAPLFWLLYLFKPGRAGIDRQDIPRFLLCALTGVAINQLLFVKGISLTTSIHASILSLVSPIFITAAAGWLLQEKFTRWKAWGLALGISGALSIVSARSVQGSPAENMLLGDVYVIINAISYSLFFVLVKPLMTRYKPLHVIRWVFTLGVGMILPFGWGDFLATDFSQFTHQAWAALALVVLAMTFLAYMLNIYGIKYLGAGITGMYIYTQPVFASIIGIVLLGEPFSLRLALAAVLIGLGVLLVNKKA